MGFDAFLKIEGIPGESTDDKHKGEIEILSFSFGISRKNERGRPNIQDFSIMKPVDTASPLLFDAACQGDPLRGTSVFTARKSGGDQLEFLKITMEDVIISSVQHSGAPGADGVPMESVSLDFHSLTMEVTKIGPDGKPGGVVKTECNARGRKD